MSLMREVRQFVDPYVAKLKGVVLRSVVQRVTSEAEKFRKLQLKILADDDDDEVEHFEPYGFSSRPQAPDSNGAAEAIVAALGACADHNVVLIVADPRYRPTDLDPGEVILFDDEGSYVKLSKRIFTDAAPVFGVAIKGDFIALGGERVSAEYSGKGVARLGDSVQVTIPAGSFLTAATGGVLNPSPVTVTGQITSSSSTVAAVD